MSKRDPLKKSLKQAMETVRREVEQSPQWLKDIYSRNRQIEEYQRAQRERRSGSTQRR